MTTLKFRAGVHTSYEDVLTPEALTALKHLSTYTEKRNALMTKRIALRSERAKKHTPIQFLDPQSNIPGTFINVEDARLGKFEGAPIPQDLQRQWIQGTGPGAKPNTPLEKSIRNVAYALLSGADGWMFDGEDALGQVSCMSLDNQRNLKLAYQKAPVFLEAAEQVSKEMNAWSEKALGKTIVADWKKQLDFTTKIFRARGLHLDDRHICLEDGTPLPASIVDMTLYVVNNYKTLQASNSSIVLYLPKIQTAEEAALWNDMLTSLETHLSLEEGTIKSYVLIEQLEASFQLMEIRAALGKHFVGFNTGRWDYINSVSDAMAWSPDFIHPNIESVTMTYGYMKNYEDRVRRAVNTPDLNGNFALWQGGMEPNIPVGSKEGVANAMEKAIAGGKREQEAGASGKWVAHWKMVHQVRPIWEKVGEANQLGRQFDALTYIPDDAQKLIELEDAPRTIRGARNLLSVALQYGNAFGQGFQAAALKPADFFGNDDVLYLMEDMATGEIRLSILWEWIHKEACLTEDDAETGLKKGDVFSLKLFQQLLEEEYTKLLSAKDKDVHNHSKETTLPIAKAIAEAYMLSPVKAPWYVDLLNLNIDQHHLETAKERIERYMKAFAKEGQRITENLDFSSNSPASNEVDEFLAEVKATEEWMNSPRFKGLTRLYSARQVVEQRGTIKNEYTLVRDTADAFYSRLRELFSKKEQITTFGPYSPGQAVAMKRSGIEGIYLGGWATSAKGSITEDPGPDLASYPLSQVPDEAAPIVRALLTADKNQKFTRLKMTEDERNRNTRVDFRPFIIADADTGHGGEAHVRNLVRRFAEVGVPGYHIEDQKPGCKKCGHQGGKVLVSQKEQILRLSAARFQLDIMGVPGIIVARTDAESANLLETRDDERDQPFVLGATNRRIPSFKNVSLALLKQFYDRGVQDLNGHLLYSLPESEYQEADAWFEKNGVLDAIKEAVAEYHASTQPSVSKFLDKAKGVMLQAWENEAGLMTYAQAVKEVMEFQKEEGSDFPMTIESWMSFAYSVSFKEARAKAKEMGIDIIWDAERARTPEGFYQVQCGIDYAISKSLAVCPFSDLLWMETKTATLEDARKFADAIHEHYPDKMLAYNLSPSFNWDTTGMSEDEMRRYPQELGKLGFVFNFITYGGHQIDGSASEEFASSLVQDGMLALARLQRKFRLLNSPYKTPQSLVGGPRMDAALQSVSGRTATTSAMGKGSTQFQHLIQTEVPVKLLQSWVDHWKEKNQIQESLEVVLKPHQIGTDLLELSIQDGTRNKKAQVIFETIQDRKGRNILSIRDQNIFDQSLRQKRVMTMFHLFLLHRYSAATVHYVSPTDDNLKQAEGMKGLQIYNEVHTEIGHIIVAHVDQDFVQGLIQDEASLKKVIVKQRSLPA